MTRLFLSVLWSLFISTTALAETVYFLAQDGVSFEYHGDATGHIDVTNGSSEPGTYIMTFATPFGDVVMTTDVTHNLACRHPCPDTYTITQVPDGYEALPAEIVVPEGSRAQIFIEPLSYLGF